MGRQAQRPRQPRHDQQPRHEPGAQPGKQPRPAVAMDRDEDQDAHRHEEVVEAAPAVGLELRSEQRHQQRQKQRVRAGQRRRQDQHGLRQDQRDEEEDDRPFPALLALLHREAVAAVAGSGQRRRGIGQGQHGQRQDVKQRIALGEQEHQPDRHRQKDVAVAGAAHVVQRSAKPGFRQPQRQHDADGQGQKQVDRPVLGEHPRQADGVKPGPDVDELALQFRRPALPACHHAHGRDQRDQDTDRSQRPGDLPDRVHRTSSTTKSL